MKMTLMICFRRSGGTEGEDIMNGMRSMLGRWDEGCGSQISDESIHGYWRKGQTIETRSHAVKCGFHDIDLKLDDDLTI